MTPAMEATQKAMSDEEVRYAIEARQKWERDRITEMNAAVEAAEARGEARGKAEGKAEATREIAKNLLAQGLTEDMVYKVTGLRPLDLKSEP
jgi:predicted transposase/invertase (TIGR01784 family)